MNSVGNATNSCYGSRVHTGNVVPWTSTIQVHSTLSSISQPRFIVCYSSDTKRYEKAKDPIVENSIFEKERDNEKSGFGNHQKIIVGIHAFCCCGEFLESFLSFVFRLLHTFEKKQSISHQNTQSKSCKGIKRVVGKQEGNQEGKNPNKPTNGLQNMNMITVLKLLKKPVHLFLRMVVLRHYYSLKSLINCTYSIAFPTNHTK